MARHGLIKYAYVTHGMASRIDSDTFKVYL